MRPSLARSSTYSSNARMSTSCANMAVQQLRIGGVPVGVGRRRPRPRARPDAVHVARSSMPPPYCVGRIAAGTIERLAAGIGHELELHAPTAPGSRPSAGPRSGPCSTVGSPIRRDAVCMQMSDRGVQVVDVERDVVSADVAVARRRVQPGRRRAYWNTSKIAGRRNGRSAAAASRRADRHRGARSSSRSRRAGTGRASTGTRSRARRRGTCRPRPRSGTVIPMWSTPAQSGQAPLAHHCTATYFDSV